MNLTIKPLEPKITKDFLNFFDNMVFTENPGWSKCYCYSFHFTGPDEEWEKEKNRAAVIDFINKGKMTGYLAFDDDKPVGWCNVNSQENYQRLMKIYKLDNNPDDKAASIVCFLISPEYRKKGIATKMLEQIIKDYTKKNFTYLEAYPGKGDLSNEKNYKGPMSLYMRFGFEIVKEIENNILVRKKL